MNTSPDQSKCRNSFRSGLSKSIQREGDQRHRDAGPDIDEERPVRQRVGEVAADRRADGRRRRRHQADQRRDQAHARAERS